MPSKNNSITASIFWKCLIFLGLLQSASSYADSSFTFSPITGINGLSDNGVRSLGQLSDGRMIVVTEGLVHLYDGVNFHYMHFDEQKAYPLNGYTGYHHIYTDSEQHLWIKTTRKLMLFDLKKERYVSNLNSYWNANKVKDTIMDFFIDADKGIWLLTDKDELLYKEKDDKHFRTFGSHISTVNGKKEVLHDLAVLNRQLYLFYQSSLIRCLTMENGKANYQVSIYSNQKNPYDKTLLVIPYKQYLYQVRNGRRGGFLNRFDTKNRSWKTLMETTYCLNTLSIDESGNCWMSSHVGLWKIDKDQKRRILISPLQLVNGKNLETEISAQYTDQQGGLWVGTYNQGLLYHHPDKWLFKRIGYANHQLNNQTAKVNCFEEFNGSVLVGTPNGLFQYHPGKKGITLFTGIPASTVCNGLYKDHSNRIYLSTRHSGIYEISTQMLKQYPLPFECRYLAESKTRQLYLCANEGFGLFDPATGAFKTISAVAKANLGAVTQLITYGKHQLLGLSEKGLFMFDEQKQTLTFPTSGSKPLFEHPNQQYSCLFEDSRGWIWFGTQDGLNVFDSSTKKSRIIRQEEGLIGNSIRGIAEDVEGNLWVTTSNGISCIEVNANRRIDALYFSNFDRTDGLMEGTFNPRSIYVTPSQHLCCGGMDGFNELDIQWASRLRTPNQKPLFTRLLISGQEIKTGVEYNGKILLPQALASTTKIILNHDQNTILLECSGLNFIHPDQTYYRYKLEGYEKEWNLQKPTDGVEHISYSGLRPGTYLLKVLASNNPRKWETPLAQLTVVIKPSAFGTPLAFVMYALLILAGSWWMFVLRRKRESTKLEMNQLTTNTKTSIDIYLNKPTVSGPDEVLLHKVLELVEKNLSSSSYSVEQLSKDLSMDRTNLYRKLSVLIDMNPSDFIRSVRLKRAALLLEKGFRVSEVAAQVGFGTTSYFSKCFQEAFGVAPSQYKKKDSNS
jgi:ligand-binding sensor domain-containing protein/AraC-like DNA-binding protein